MDETSTAAAEIDAGEIYAIRKKRIEDAVALKEPDRVPYYLSWRFWSARQAGMTCEQAMYDPAGLSAAIRKMMIELQPDTYQLPHNLVAIGGPLEILGFKALAWPGHGCDPDVCYQYIDQEFMTPDEYDEYLFDPSGYILRTYLPRVGDGLEGPAATSSCRFIGVSTVSCRRISSRHFTGPNSAT